MKEFKINDYITLKLENNNTVIYVDNEAFLQCKYLLLELDKGDLEQYDELESIDEVVKYLDHSLAVSRKASITPETEFWGHCSNMQVWVEYGYDTRLLRSNLSFPLLKRLSELGDSKAALIFREEIYKRFESGSPGVIEYLLNEHYLDFLDEEEQSDLIMIILRSIDKLGITSKIYSYFNFITSLKNSTLISPLYKLLESDFSAILMWFTQYSLPIFVPDAFEKWLISVINAPFLERKFFDILSMINSHSDKPTIRRLFTKIISIFHETELIIKNDDFIQNQLQIILNELPQWKNTLLDKFYRVIDFAQLLTAVKKTPLLNRNMTHILETYKEIKQILERIKSDQNREEARLSLDSALDGTILKKLAGTE